MRITTIPVFAMTAIFFGVGTPSAYAALPSPDHIVVAIMENHDYASIIGSPDAPYINSLLTDAALMTDSHGFTHPSQPNYLVMFSGSTQGVVDDACPIGPFATENLAHLLIANGDSFAIYSEDLPAEGSTTCSAGSYKRKHNPAPAFANVPSTANKPFTAFPSDYTALPTVSWVVPNQLHDMHDGTVAQGDHWLEQNLGAYIDWARTHNSLFVLTWDEDDFSVDNHIPTLLVGEQVRPGSYAETIGHLDLLRTVEDIYGLGYAGASDSASTLTDVWRSCGDGIADLGEECDEPALGCGGGLACQGCVCVNPAPCPSDIPLLSASLTVVADPFLMKLKAGFVLPKPWSAVDPVAHGIRVVLDETEAVGGIDATIPGGAGWTVNKAGTRWVYVDGSGSVAGITRIVVTDKSGRRDGLVSVVVRGSGGIATLPQPGGARLSILLGAADECGWAGSAARPLTCSVSGVRMGCR